MFCVSCRMTNTVPTAGNASKIQHKNIHESNEVHEVMMNFFGFASWHTTKIHEFTGPPNWVVFFF